MAGLLEHPSENVVSPHFGKVEVQHVAILTRAIERNGTREAPNIQYWPAPGSFPTSHHTTAYGRKHSTGSHVFNVDARRVMRKVAVDRLRRLKRNCIRNPILTLKV
jgi:hypothetical protein